MSELETKYGITPVKWETCSRCKGKYVPSMTSHPEKCGVCAPLKYGCHSRVAEIRAGTYVSMAEYIDKFEVEL